MRFKLKNRPRPYSTRKNPTKSEVAWFRWCKGFEARQKDNYNNPEDWLTQNFPLIMQHYGYKKPSEVTFEDVIQFYIKQETLGE